MTRYDDYDELCSALEINSVCAQVIESTVHLGAAMCIATGA